MIEVGRLCLKIAGRDAGGKCVVVDVLDDKFVTIDGNVRRRKCNVLHLEPLKDVIKIDKGASHDAVKAEFDKLKISVWETKKKEKTTRPKKVRGKKKKVEKEKEAKKGKKAKSPKKPSKGTEKGLEKRESSQKAEAKPKEEKPAKKAEETESVEELLGGEAEVKAKEEKK
ncbi:50S ribosomal protein L14e [Candidatus Woesearchaeota archaeon]|nr:50S ribosomal protein L14e [Candidatus Woesearchaeota archaeon]